MTQHPTGPDQSSGRAQPPMSSPGRTWAADATGPIPKIEGYKVLSLLGHGGMGVVWRAIRLGMNRHVALKLMSNASLGSERACLRFEREVELAAGLDHPNIARVYDSGLDLGGYYYAMELIDGVPLDHYYVASHALTHRQIVQLFRTVCLAVQHAHQRGVIHRDLKPSNILVTEDGRPYVLDFGLAKTLSEGGGGDISRAGDVAGTVAYMSPEQVAGDLQQIDTRSDVYALGVILYGLLLKGRHPHELGGTETQVRDRIAKDEIRLPRDVNHDIDTELKAILLKALAKSPEDRYSSAGELARDIDNYLRGEPLVAQPPTIAYILRKRLRRYRVPITIAVTFIVSVFVLISVGYLRERGLREEAERARGIALREVEATRRALYFNRIALVQAYDGNNIARAKELLLACPKDLRHWEWYHLWQTTDEAIKTIGSGHNGVLFVGFDNNGQRVVAADDHTIQIWDTASGQLVMTLGDDSFHLKSVAMSADGRYIASGCDRGVVVWDAATGNVIKTRSASALAVALGPDGQQIASSGRDPITQIWDRRSGKIVMSLRTSANEIRALAFSPDGRYVAAGGSSAAKPSWRDVTLGGEKPTKQQGVLTVWDAHNGTELKTIHLSAVVHSVTFSRDSRWIAWGGWGAIGVWDAVLGKEQLTFRGDGRALAFGPDSRQIAAGGTDATIGIWDIDTGVLSSSLRGHQRLINSLAFSADGKHIVSGSSDATIKLWDVRSRKKPFNVGSQFLAMSPDGRTVVGVGQDKSVKLLNTASGKIVATFPAGGQDDLDSVALDPGSERIVLISGVASMTMTLWDVESASVVSVFRGEIRRPVFSPDGRRVVALSSDVIMVWDSRSGQELSTLRGHGGPVRTVAFSPDGRRLVSAGDDRSIRVWDIDTAKEILAIEGHETNIARVAFGLGGRLIIALDFDDRIGLWEADSGRQIKILQPLPRARSLAFSPDGRFIAVGGYGVIKLVDTVADAEMTTLHGHEEFVEALAFSPDGKRLASGGDDATIKLWDAESGMGTEIMTLQGHQDDISFLGFSSDGSRIVSVSRDGLGQLWDAPKDAGHVTQPHVLTGR